MGKANEHKALQLYQEKQIENGHDGLFSCRSRFAISKDYPFLGASPDAMVMDPSDPEQFGLAEIKCPYSVRNITCSSSNFFCKLSNYMYEE